MPQAPQKMPKQDLCNENVFFTFYKKHSRDLYNFMYYKSGNANAASDLVQDAFVKIFENCGKIDFSKAKSYLFTTANNLFLNSAKHEKVKLNYNQNNPAEDRDHQNPEFLLQEKEFMQRLEKAIANLTEAQREVFLLNRIDGKKYREIAEMLDISEKAVEKRMMAALKTLRVEIGNI
jgi:RNA polymerase sigma-70 factor (family 1)